MTTHADYVLRSVEERRVRFVRLWFVDVLGILKSVAVPASELEAALEDGVGIDGSSLEGRVREHERDVVAVPDPATFQLLPWRTDAVVGRMFCELRTLDGEPFAADSRQALRRVLAEAADLGYTFQVGAEVEFFLFAEPAGDGAGPPRPLDDGGYYDLTPLDVGSDFRRRTIDHLEGMSIPVRASHHEVAPSQHEIALDHTDALSMADAVTTFRLAVKEVAGATGVYATFMPKPLEEHPGSGLHLHLSLFRGDENAFAGDGGDGAPLSPVGRQFLAGVLAHARELSAATNQWVNSYKRLVAGDEAPEHVTWARHARSALARVPAARRPEATRVELRSPDPSCNPYLVFALVLAAGLRGVERGYGLPVEGEGPPLPESLGEATELLDRSELARDTLGDRLTDWIVANQRREWADFRRTVTEFERRRLLGLL